MLGKLLPLLPPCNLNLFPTHCKTKVVRNSDAFADLLGQLSLTCLGLLILQTTLTWSFLAIPFEITHCFSSFDSLPMSAVLRLLLCHCFFSFCYQLLTLGIAWGPIFVLSLFPFIPFSLKNRAFLIVLFFSFMLIPMSSKFWPLPSAWSLNFLLTTENVCMVKSLDFRPRGYTTK